MAIAKMLFLGCCVILTSFATSQAAIEPVSEEQAEKWLENKVPKYERLKSAFASVYRDFFVYYYPQFSSAHWKDVIASRDAMNTYHHELGLVTSASDWRNFEKGTVRRQFMYLAALGVDALIPTVNYLAGSVDYNRTRDIKSNMSSTYSKAKICKDDNTCYTERELSTFIEDPATSEQDLLWAWQAWRDATGKKFGSMYSEFTNLLNKAAKLQGYPDMGAMRRFEYEMDGRMPDVMTSLVEKLLPKFKLLHGYVRRQLIKEHGDAVRTKTGHIPAHLIRDMGAEDWRKTIKLPFDWTRDEIDREADETIKFKCKDDDPREAAKKLWELAETFYTKNGLDALPESFWENAKLVKDECKYCGYVPWNFFNGTVSLSGCTRVSYRGFRNALFTLAHVKRMEAFSDKQAVFQEAPNAGFNYGAVDPFTRLTGWKIRILKDLGLIKPKTFNDFIKNKEAEINLLMEEALLVFPKIINAFISDSWRWDVQSGAIKPENYNAGWWKKQCKYHGISPSVRRSEEDFDPGSKSVIAKNTQYIKEAVRKIVSFQLHKAFCERAFPGYTDVTPLHQCAYVDRDVGELIRKLFEPGRSQRWQDTLYEVTGSDSMAVEPLLEYFEPLFEWLEEEQKNACKEEQTKEACNKEGFEECCDSSEGLIRELLKMLKEELEFDEE